MYALKPETDDDAAQTAQRAYETARALLQQEDFVSKVSDDITLLAAANPQLLCSCPRPAFSQEEWNAESKRYLLEKQEKLYPQNPPVPPAPEGKIPTEPSHPVPETPSPEPPEPNRRQTPVHEFVSALGRILDTTAKAPEPQPPQSENRKKNTAACSQCRILFTPAYHFCPYCGRKLRPRAKK